MFVPVTANAITALMANSCLGHNKDENVLAFDAYNQSLTKDVSKTVASRTDQDTASCIAQPISYALAENIIGRKPENGGNHDGFTEGGPMYTLNATGVHGVAQTPVIVHGTQDPCVSNIAFAQGRNNGGENVLVQSMAYAFDSLSSNSMKSSNPISGVNEVSVSKTLDTSRGLDPSCNQGGLGLVQSMAVRRLTPVECERLQGFPDGYSNIPWRKKDESPDGPRYKALGNSWAVPVVRWIGKRMQEALNADS
jgi:DNA (cytosine-5)-methyltransferase 1